MMSYDIRDIGLADRGQHKIAWAARNMPVLRQITEEFAASRPFTGRRIAAALHITPETAVLMRALQAGGAQIALCASNPLSTRDDICAALAVDGMAGFAIYGADLIAALHQRPSRGSTFLGIEETTTGVTRVRAMAATGALTFPVIAVNDTPTKHLFDNR